MSSKARTEIPAVVKTVVVKCAPRDAYRYFTEDMARWWPLASYSCIASQSKGARAPESCVIEPREGGRLFERGGGEEHDWGKVTVWEPPSRLGFSWHPERGPDTAQHVEVTFTPEAGGTRVTLTHSGWERLGKDAAATRDNYDGGWETVFVTAFAEYANAAQKV